MKNYIIIIFLLLSSYGFTQDIIISTQPSAIRECFGNSTSLYVLAYSESKQELKYQWYKDDAKLISVNSATLKFENLDHNHTGLYYCEISNNVEIIRTNITPVYVLRNTSITKEPEDVSSSVNNENVSVNFEAHVNGTNIDEAIKNGEFVKIQWFQKNSNINNKLDNNDIYEGVNSSRLNINTKSLADTNYYFAEIEGQCGKARTRHVRIIKNLHLLNISINGLEACEGNIETIKANVNNPNNYELEFQWYKNNKAIHYKENLDGYYTDEITFNPIHLLDSGIYKLEGRIKGTNYSVFSNEAIVDICSKPEIIAVRIDSLTFNRFSYKQTSFNIYFKTNCLSSINIYKNELLLFDNDSILEKSLGYNCPSKNFGIYRMEISNKRDERNSKYRAEIINRCGTDISETLSINEDLNEFKNRDPWGQYREFCEEDTTTIEYYFHNLPHPDYDISWTFISPSNSLYRQLDFIKNFNFYSGLLSNKFHFRNIRVIDSDYYYLQASNPNPDYEFNSYTSPLFYFKVNPIPHIKRQPINKTLNYGKKDTLFYIFFDNEKQIPMSLDLYYMASLASKPRLIDKSEVEWGLWFRYINEVTFADRGYYYAVSKHYNDCKSVISDTIYIDVLPEGISSIDEIENNRLIISPNPATDFITINLSTINRRVNPTVDGDVVVEIYDVMGLLIHSTPSASQPPLNEGNLRIDISNLSTGVYFVKIGDKVEKFVKY